MPKDKTNPQEELAKLIQANHFNFTTDNLEKVKDLVKGINIAVNDHLKSNISKKSPYYNINSQILNTIRGTITLNDKSSGTNFDNNPNNISPGGIRSIGEFGSYAQYEGSIIESSKEVIANAFVQFNEFKAICSLIPELGKVVKMFSRDILNVNDVTKNVFANIFHMKDFENQEIYTKEVIEEMNKEFIEKVIETNDLERKVRRYIKESLIKGCNPVSVIPYKEILNLISKAAQNSNEDLATYANNYLLNDDNLYLPNLRERCVENVYRATERAPYNHEIATMIKPDDSVYDDILNYCNKSIEDYLVDEINKFKSAVNSLSVEEEDRKELDELKEKMKDDNLLQDVKKNAKSMFMNIIDQIDQKVEVVSPANNKNLLALARKTLEKTLKFKDYVATKSEITINDFTHKNTDFERDDKNKTGMMNRSINKYNNSDLKDLANNVEDVLITEYDPQNVIPFIINGKHIGYWILEEEQGSTLMKARRNFMTFTDIVGSLGYGDDAVMGGNGVPGIITNMVGGPDGTLAPTIGAGVGLSSFGSIGISALGNNNTDNLKIIDMLKELLVKTVANRLNASDLADDKIFRDAMMNLLRDGYIVDKKVRITFIPEQYMVYFPYEMDDLGLPKALFSDTLLFCYLYISSVIQSLMIKMHKSSSKDKIEFNMGANKNIGASIRMIDNTLSTRNTHSFDAFKNIREVIKNSVVHDRIIIPVINGEKMFNYEQMERYNDLNIDDEYTKKLLDSILSVTPIPTSMLNKLEEDEYSRSIISQHINYVNGIVDCQANYNPEINKLLKLIAKNIKFENEHIKDNLNKIDFRLAVPNKLNITNIQTALNDSQSYIDSMATYLFTNLAEDPLYADDINEFKFQLAKILVPEADWENMDEIKKQVLDTHNERLLEKRKRAKINAKNDEAGTDTGGFSAAPGGDTGGEGGEEGGEEEGNDDFGMDDMGDMSF